MKKIVFVTGRLGGGGSERVLTLIANQMRQDGYDVSIISFGGNANEYDNACDVIYLNCTNNINLIFNLRKKICSLSPDVLIAFEYHVGMKTILASIGLNAKVIVSERNDPHVLDVQKAKKVLRDILYRKLDCLVCQTPDARAYFNPQIRKKAVVIGNPIKSDLPEWVGQDSNVLLNYCRLEKQKNLPMLIKAFELVRKNHPEAILEIYGEGNEEENLRNLIKDNNLDSCVKLNAFSSKIHQIAANAYAFVSSSDYEGISNSMLESMAMGMPVVCTDCPIGGARMVIQDGINGILVPVGDYKKMAERINEIIDNKNKAVEMAASAKELRYKYSIEKIVEMWEKCVEIL